MNHIALIIIIGLIGFCNEPTINDPIDKCSTVHFIDSRNYTFSIGDTIESWDLKYIALDCDGKLKVLEYYHEGGLLSEKYFEGEKTTKVVSVYDPNTTTSHLDTSEYFKRIPTGVWTFYHKDGSNWKTINFDN